MKLLIVGVRWPPETFLWNRYKALAEQGVQVSLVVSARPRAGELPPGIHAVTLPSRRYPVMSLKQTGRAVAQGLLQPSLFGNVRRAIHGRSRLLPPLWKLSPLLSLQPDVVHFEWNSAAIAYRSMLPIWGAPSVVSCRGREIQIRPHLPGEAWFVDALRESFTMMSAVHCVSEAIAAEATEFGLRRNKTVVIRPSVDIEYFKTKQSRARPDGPVRFVSTGALTWGKGWEYLLLAVKYALNSGCQICLDIIGEGPDRQRVEYAIYDLGLSHNVSLLGSLPPTTVRNRLQGADVFVLASLSEGISNAALEGMACGLPVVTTDCGGMTEAVADGEEGFVVPTRDSAGLAEAIVKFASDTELRLSMGARARARVERDFSLAQQTQEFIDLYSRLLSASAS